MWSLFLAEVFVFVCVVVFYCGDGAACEGRSAVVRLCSRMHGVHKKWQWISFFYVRAM